MLHRGKDRRKHRAQSPNYADNQHYYKSSSLASSGSSLYADEFIEVGRKPLRRVSRRSNLATSNFDTYPYENQYSPEAPSQSDGYRPDAPHTTIQGDVPKKKQYYDPNRGFAADSYHAHEQQWDGYFPKDHRSSGRGSLYDLDMEAERYRLKARSPFEGDRIHSGNATYVYEGGESPCNYSFASVPQPQNEPRLTFETTKQSFHTLDELREPIYSMSHAPPIFHLKHN